MKISPQQKKWIIIVLSSVLVLGGIGLAVGLSKREAILKSTIHKVQQKLKKDYDVNFEVAHYQFDGLATVVFDRVSIVPVDRDTLVDLRRLGVRVRIFPLLWGEVKIGDLDVEDGRLSFVKKDSLSNYDFLFRKKVKDSVEIEQPSEKNFAAWTEKLTKQVFSKIPSNLSMRNFELSYQDSSTVQKLRVPEAVIDGGDFETSVFLNENEAEWILRGYVDGDEQKLRVEVSSREKGTELPFLRKKFGLKVSFDKIVFDLHHVKRMKNDLLNVDGEMEYHNLVVNHRRLSDRDIVVPHVLATGGFDISNDFVALSEGSSITVKDFTVAPKVKYERKPKNMLALSVHTGRFEAQNFFNAIPQGLFESLAGVEVKGDIAYDLDFSVDLDRPDDITFMSSIDDKDIKIVRWGQANVDSLNYPFVYAAYDDTTKMRDIVVGPQNPHFLSLQRIPYVLKTTVRNTEDPFFYKHNGFEEEAFKLSISTNLKERKFKRGASTISMQLVKNVFLSRKKTMDRKLEEILLVWLMEASKSVSKDRLLEIYLNVIEWGKNVYGISEASHYYFNKPAQELTLGESLYLSSIIPRPKTGLSSFDYTGHLKPWVQGHFNTYGHIMTKVGDLNSVVVPANYGFYEVVLQSKLRPAAPALTAVQDSINTDIVEDHERIMKEIEQEDKVKKSILDKLFGKEK